MIPLPIVKFRKLGRLRSLGNHSDIAGEPPKKRPGVITIDPRLEGRKRLEIFIHECLHEYYPYLEEWAVAVPAEQIARVLWKHGFRHVPD